MQVFLIAAAIVSLTPVRSPEPNRQPQIASAPGLTALVFGSQHSVWLSASHDNGLSFLPPAQIASVPGLMLGRHRGPRIAISGKTIVVSAVYGDTPAHGNLVAWQSADGGSTWSKPVVVNDSPGSAREGLHSMVAGPDGELAAVWLDLRAAGTRLYGAYSRDGGASWSKNVLLYKSSEATICECCDPSIAPAGQHRFSVMFRNVASGNRDMYTADWNTSSGVSKPEKLGVGSWLINACPMDGGGIAATGSKTITAWRRERTVYLDEAGQPEVALGEGKDVALAVTAKGPYVAWSNASGVQIHRPDQPRARCISPRGGFPVLGALPNGSVLAAWEQDGKIDTMMLN